MFVKCDHRKIYICKFWHFHIYKHFFSNTVLGELMKGRVQKEGGLFHLKVCDKMFERLRWLIWVMSESAKISDGLSCKNFIAQPQRGWLKDWETPYLPARWSSRLALPAKTRQHLFENKLASCIDAIAISEIWNYPWLEQFYISLANQQH